MKQPNQADEALDTAELIEKTGAITTTNAPHQLYCLSIIGQIEGHYILPEQNKTTKYEHIIPTLAAVEQDKSVEGLLVILNTVGGDVEAGLAISELIAGMQTPTASLVVGGGHSIGVPLAVCTRKSFIVPSATMTLHPVRVSGMVINAPQSIDYLKQMQQRVVRFVCEHSHLTEERFYQMLQAREDMANDVGTILDGDAAVQCGLIGRVGGLGDALEEIHNLIGGEHGGPEVR